MAGAEVGATAASCLLATACTTKPLAPPMVATSAPLTSKDVHTEVAGNAAVFATPTASR